MHSFFMHASTWLSQLSQGKNCATLWMGQQSFTGQTQSQPSHNHAHWNVRFTWVIKEWRALKLVIHIQFKSQHLCWLWGETARLASITSTYVKTTLMLGVVNRHWNTSFSENVLLISPRQGHRTFAHISKCKEIRCYPGLHAVQLELKTQFSWNSEMCHSLFTLFYC